jgi:MFS family permease
MAGGCHGGEQCVGRPAPAACCFPRVSLLLHVTDSMEVLSALLFGRLSDRLGRFPCYLGALAFELANPLFFSVFPVVLAL